MEMSGGRYRYRLSCVSDHGYIAIERPPKQEWSDIIIVFLNKVYVRLTKGAKRVRESIKTSRQKVHVPWQRLHLESRFIKFLPCHFEHFDVALDVDALVITNIID